MIFLKKTIIGSAYLVSGSILIASAHIANSGNSTVGTIGSIMGVIGIVITLIEYFTTNEE